MRILHTMLRVGDLQRSIDFYTKVREGYLLLAKNMPERVILVDGTHSTEVVAQTIWEHVKVRLFG